MTSEPAEMPRQQSKRHVILGAGMIVVGATLFIARRLPWDIDWWRSWWTVALFGLGVVRLFIPADRESLRDSRQLAAWLMTIGAWGFVSSAELFGLTYANSWPLLIVGVGLNITGEAIFTRDSRRPQRGDAR